MGGMETGCGTHWTSVVMLGITLSEADVGVGSVPTKVVELDRLGGWDVGVLVTLGGDKRKDVRDECRYESLIILVWRI